MQTINKISILTIVVLFTILINQKVLAGSGNSGNAYLVKQRIVDSVPEALSILRRFIPTKQNFDEKCQRYAVLLKSMVKQPLNQFDIAEFGLVKSNSINDRYKEINVETLRQLYIDAISKSLQGHVDLSMIELVDCLIRKFRSHDAKARAFLNSDELRQTVEQYKSIMGQPLTFLMSDNKSAKHPTLSSLELQPAIRKTMSDLFNNNELELKSHFPLREQINNQIVGQQQQQFAMATAGTGLPRETSASAVAATGNGGVYLANDELSKEELAYLGNLIESLRKVYSSLPIQSTLNNRCQAYSKVIDADPNLLNNQLVQNVVNETSDLISKQAQSSAKFMPQKDTRENFLVALNSFGPEQRDATWIDIIDCVSEWEHDDEDIKAYLNSPELVHVIEEMLKTLDNQQQVNNRVANEASDANSASRPSQ